MNETKPNLFVVGFSKAGTTALVDYLKQHPDIFVPWLKEPHTLYMHQKMPLWASKGEIEDRSGKHKFSFASYMLLYTNAIEYKYRVDASTSYTFDKMHASAIKEFSPSAKVILCIRNQIDRLLSSYMYTYIHHKVGFDLWLDKYFIPFIDSFLIMDKLEEFYKVFNDDLVIIQNNDLRTNYDTILTNTFLFLGLKPIPISPIFSNTRFVSPASGFIYKYSIFTARECAIRALYLSRLLNIEKYFWYAVNRFHNNKVLVKKHNKENEYYKLIRNKIPRALIDILEDDYLKTLEFIENKGISINKIDKMT